MERPQPRGPQSAPLATLLLSMAPFAAVTAALIPFSGFHPRTVVVASLIFILYKLVLVRGLLSRHNVRGLRLSAKGEYEEALLAFRFSEGDWAARPWLDRNRSWVLGSAGSDPFVVVSRVNQAHCLLQIGRADEARAIVDQALCEFPDSSAARSALLLLEPLPSQTPANEVDRTRTPSEAQRTDGGLSEATASSASNMK